MPIFRLLIFGIAVWLAIQIIRRMLRNRRPVVNAHATRDMLNPVEMVACQHCGLHVPHHEVFVRGAYFYCCPQHRDAD